MLKKIIPFILIFCLLFATAVMAEDVPMGRGNRPQGGPPEGFNPGNGEFTPPEGFDPSQRPDFGNGTPPEGFNPGNREVAPPENKGAPVTETARWNSDGVIETYNTSGFATVADMGTTLGADYVQAVDMGRNMISPDNIVDASTCQAPMQTWFTITSTTSMKCMYQQICWLLKIILIHSIDCLNCWTTQLKNTLSTNRLWSKR